MRNRHVQTILGHLWVGPQFRHPTVRHLVPVVDGDQLVLHDALPERWRRGDPIAVLLHGLGGCHLSGHQQRLAQDLLARDVRSVRVDLRGAGAGLQYARKAYHAGRSDDLRAVLAEVHSWSPESPLLVMGVSMGGNIVLKLLAEAATEPVPGLQRALAIGPPIDLSLCAALLKRKGNLLYNRWFTRLLLRQERARQRAFPDLPRLPFRGGMTLREFDDLYTAPRNQFADAEDYYRRASSFPLLDRIQLPSAIVTARDDPFIAVEPFEEARLPACVELHITAHGGHLGFLGDRESRATRAIENWCVRWLLEPFKT